MSVVAVRTWRVFDVDNEGWREEHADGTFVRVVTRRTDDPGKQWNEMRFVGATLAEAEAGYALWLEGRSDTVHRTAARRAKWGPLELKK